MASVARSLVFHHAFAGAYHGYNGPTAWLAPVYPFVIACVFRVFGPDSRASALVLLVINIAVSSLTAVVIVRLGREYLSEKVGLIAGWAWALSPLGALMPLLLWDTSLSALMLSLSLLFLLRANSALTWAGAGILWGTSALVSPALLAPLPAILVSQLRRAPDRVKAGAMFLLTLVCVLVPWSIRNHFEMHAVFPVRSNAWAEIYFGNINFGMHPAASSTGLYQQAGETRFVEQLKRETIQYIRNHPAQFVWASMKRWVRFWFVPLKFLPLTLIAAVGSWASVVLLLRKFDHFLIPFAWVLIFYPIIFSMTHIEARYRHSIEPIIYLLAVRAGCEAYNHCRSRLETRESNP